MAFSLMNGRHARQRRDAEERAFRAQVLSLMESQKGVIGALARGLTAAQKDIEDLKLQLADVESAGATS